jgi:hypothetical protein
MRGYRLTVLFILILFIVAVSAVALRKENQQAQEHQQAIREQKAKNYLRGQKVRNHQNQLPIADYDAPEPSDPVTRAKRLAKNKSFNDPREEKKTIAEIGVRARHNEWEWGLESSIPSAQSSAVIVGKVTDAQAYVSEDKSNVYSEYTVQVEEVLKNDTKEPIAVGDLLTTEREGGRVRFPSGRISTLYISNQGVPQVGRRYVLFLGFNPYEVGTKKLTGPRGDMRRHILTGYELHAGKVFLLDSAGGRNFQEHKDKDETSFLDEIRRSINNP